MIMCRRLLPEALLECGIECWLYMQMISAETVGISIKNQAKADLPWNMPVALAGNSLFMNGRTDNKGQLKRRTVLLNFTREVESENILLDYEIARCMPAIILKASRAFKVFLAYRLSQGVRSCLPAYFGDVLDEVGKSMHGQSLRGKV